MKKCSKCNYATEHKEYRICPICGEELIDTEETHLHMVGITQGQPVSTPIRLTDEEVKLIKKISKELSKNTSWYHTQIWIDE